jgi:hypothetical protein
MTGRLQIINWGKGDATIECKETGYELVEWIQLAQHRVESSSTFNERFSVQNAEPAGN